MINLKISDQWISNEEACKYEAEFHANARIIDLSDFPMEPHNDWINYHLMGDTMVYLGFLVHTNDITSIDEKITTIGDLKTCRNINEQEGYQKLAGFNIRLLVTPSAMLTVFVDCTGKIKTNWTREVRISLRRVIDILCAALTLLQHLRIYFLVCSDPYAISVQAF